MIRPRALLAGLLGSGLLLVGPLGASTASADFDITSFNAATTTSDAGARPDLSIGFTFDVSDPNDRSVRTIVTDLPPGLIGDPSATPFCSTQDFGELECPAASQVGAMTALVQGFGPLTGPLFNLEPRNDEETARLGFSVPFIALPVIMRVGVRAGDYAIRTTASNVNSQVTFEGADISLWGVPADPSHDPERWSQEFGAFGPPVSLPPGTVERKPFLTNPTACGGPLELSLEAFSWENPDDVSQAPPANLPPVTGCESLHFDPTISVQPISDQADSPTGLDVNLDVPQNGDPDGRATSHLTKAVVALPEGTTVNPAAADGLGGCSKGQIGLVSESPTRFDDSQPTCPDASQVGTTEINTPLLPVPLKGSLYLARQDDNPADTLLSGYLYAKGQGVVLKLYGVFEADPQTGRITATFEDNPQLPFDHLNLRFKGGSRGVLATPQTCGTFTTTTELTPWSAPDSGPPATPSDSFTITSGPNGTPCVSNLGERPFAPGFNAGTVHPLAGINSPFVLRATRADGHQELKRISADLPPGLLAKLAGIPYCSEAALASISQAPGTGAAEAASPSCPAASRLGTARVGAGAGAQPFYLSGGVYLTGPYQGAPLGLAIVIPAVAGPLDLGTEVVRSKLQIDPDDAQVHVQSDPIPHILEGIPLRIRDVRVLMDRPGFIQNPTSCDPMSVTGQLTGAGGDLASAADDTIVPVSQHFQVGGCGGLGFSPTLTTTIMNGKDGIHRSDHPELLFDLKTTPGQANLKSVDVLLPSAFQIDQANLGNLCSETELAQTQCAGRNPIGHASAATPLLDNVLAGPVYAVTGSGGLPRLAVILRGAPHQPVELLIRAETTTVGNRIRNTFPLIPDAQISDFALTLTGGPGGYLVNNQDVCTRQKGKKKLSRKQRAKLRNIANKRKRNRARRKMLTTKQQIFSNVSYLAQNNKTKAEQVRVAAPCGKKGKKKKKRKRSRAKR